MEGLVAAVFPLPLVGEVNSILSEIGFTSVLASQAWDLGVHFVGCGRWFLCRGCRWV